MAIAVLEKARATQEARLGADHPDTLTTLNNLAWAYRAAGRLAEAIRLLEQVRDVQVTKLKPNHPHTLTTLNNLALAYQDAGQRAEAIQLLEQLRDVKVSKLGADHPSTLTTLHNLAGAYQDTGRLEEAIRLLEQVRDVQVTKLRPDHPHTLTTLNNLALAYQDAGRLEEAIRLLEQVHDARVSKLGADHPSTLTTLDNLALAYQDAGRLEEAIRLLEQAATGIEKRGFQHQHAHRIIPNTAAAYEEARQFGKAEAWRRKWLAHVKEKAGAESLPYAADLVALGFNLLQQKKWAEAETVLRECLTIREKKQPDAWTTFNTMSLLGGALLGQKKYAEAEPLLLKGYEGLNARVETIPAEVKTQRLGEALDRLIELYTALDKPAEVQKYQAEKAKLSQSKGGKQ
jgi:tetratricopeptide (TPR) repeat protein